MSDMTLNITPDWQMVGTITKIKKDIDFLFNGPGWYLLENGETSLIFPFGDFGRNPWKAGSKWPKGQKWVVWHFYANPAQSFNFIANAPVRRDKREYRVKRDEARAK